MSSAELKYGNTPTLRRLELRGARSIKDAIQRKGRMRKFWLVGVVLIMLARMVRAEDEHADRFAGQLLGVVAKADENVLYSPVSVEGLVRMLAIGATPGTREEMLKMISREGATNAALVEEQRELGKKLRAEKGVELTIADSIWTARGWEVKSEFAKNMKSLGASAEEVDFLGDAADRINAWAKQQTHGRIDQVVDRKSLGADTRLVAADAVYFKGKWLHRFEEDSTREAPFHVTPEKTVKAQIMWNSARDYGYRAAEDIQVVTLPYIGGNIAMSVVLPKDSAAMDRVEKQVDSDGWTALIGKTKAQEVLVGLPRFEMSASMNLNEPLQKLGMQSAFVPGNRFSGIADEKLWLSEVKQKAWIKVDEEGTEAAAVTTGIMVGAVARPGTRMLIDRPFLFVIRDGSTVLFAGRVNDPTAKGE
jgi:serine protease inhibitor